MSRTSRPVTGRRGARRARRGRLTSVHVRLLLCLGMLALPAGVGTMAYWTDTATISSGPISSGTLDLTVGTTAADSVNLPGQGGTYEYSQLTIANLVPGESIARPFAVHNAGNVPFSYNGAISTINDNLVASGSGLRVQIYVDGDPSNAGAEATGDRAGTCTGTLVSDQALSTTTTTVNIHPTNQVLAVGATRVYCARILLHASSPTTMQGRSTALVIGLNATQLGAA